jgi:hypothetical protein
MNKYLPIVLTVNYLTNRGYKTTDYMSRTVDSLVRDLYNGDITEGDFQDAMFSLIEVQFQRAFNEGMRNNGLDPVNDMTPEWDAEYQRMVTDQLQYIEQFAKDIVDGKNNGQSKDEFMARADLWANQYQSTVNEAQMITADNKDKFKWTLGATENHCTTCSQLDGIVAWAEEWEQSGFHPQQAPNDLLECGGWRCDCSLEPTDEKRSADALGRLLDIATGGNV